MVKAPKLAIIIAIAGPLAVAGAADSSAATINGAAIKAAAPAVTIDVRYRAQAARPDRDHPYNWNYRAIHIGGIDPIITGIIQAIWPIHRIGRIPTTTLTATAGKPNAAAAAVYLRAAAAGVALVISDDAGGRTLRSIGQLSRLQRLFDADVDYVTPHQRTRGRICSSQR